MESMRHAKLAHHVKRKFVENTRRITSNSDVLLYRGGRSFFGDADACKV